MYKTIDQWFGSPISKKHKTIFYFDSNIMESKWLSDDDPKIKKYQFSKIIKFNNVPVKICANLNQSHNFALPNDVIYNEKHITFLKSNLQKCIRRQLNQKAIKTAYHMIKININEFIRRLLIIVLEDVALHESYSTLVWLMVATCSTKNANSNFKPNKYIIDWLLGFVNMLCDIDHYDDVINSNTKYNVTDFDDYDLLYSLELRKTYGGMKCDMEMITDYIIHWLDKFKHNQKCNNTIIQLIDSSNVKHLTFDDWKLDDENMAGIDFHCAPYIINDICKKFNYTEKEIQSCIWNCSSGINKRKPKIISTKDNIIWALICTYLFELQKTILHRYIIQ